MPVNIVKMKPLLIALDVSASTGMIVMDSAGALVHKEEIELSKIKNDNGLIQRMERMKKLFLYTVDTIKKFEPKVLIVEGYATHGKFIQYQQFELGAVVRSAFYNRNIKIWEISPTALKKAVCDTGAAKKDQMRLAIYKKWAFEDKSDNVVDAYALARMGLCLQKWAEPGTVAEREVIEKIVKGDSGV